MAAEENLSTKDAPLGAVVTHPDGTKQNVGGPTSAASTATNPNDTVTGLIVLSIIGYLLYRFLKR